MRRRNRCILVLMVVLFGCADLIESGEFKSDAQMKEFLKGHLDEFTELGEMKGECNQFYASNGNDLIVTDACQHIFDKLGIDYVHYYRVGDEERITLRIYHLVKWMFNEYSKGYLFRYDSIEEIVLFDRSLDDFPRGGPCDNWYRTVEIENVDTEDRWFIYDDRFCD